MSKKETCKCGKQNRKNGRNCPECHRELMRGTRAVRSSERLIQFLAIAKTAGWMFKEKPAFEVYTLDLPVKKVASLRRKVDRYLKAINEFQQQNSSSVDTTQGDANSTGQ